MNILNEKEVDKMLVDTLDMDDEQVIRHVFRAGYELAAGNAASVGYKNNKAKKYDNPLTDLVMMILKIDAKSPQSTPHD